MLLLCGFIKSTTVIIKYNKKSQKQIVHTFNVLKALKAPETTLPHPILMHLAKRQHFSQNLSSSTDVWKKLIQTIVFMPNQDWIDSFTSSLNATNCFEIGPFYRKHHYHYMASVRVVLLLWLEETDIAFVPHVGDHWITAHVPNFQKNHLTALVRAAGTMQPYWPCKGGAESMHPSQLWTIPGCMPSLE